MKQISEITSVQVSRQPEQGLQPSKLAGRVAMAGHRAALEWAPEEIERKRCLDPIHYPLAPGLIEARGDLFGGLHGFLADSLPDAWGMRLLARRLRREGIALGALTCVQRLSLVGHYGRGALVYDPCFDGDDAASLSMTAPDIDDLARAAHMILTDNGEQGEAVTSRLLELLGSGSGGARPKAHVELDGEAWIVKFPGLSDPADIGPIEQAYMQMAAASGLDVTTSCLLPSSRGPGWFATKRFDRVSEVQAGTRGKTEKEPRGGRIHMVSLCGAIEAPSGISAIGYDTFMRATLAITRNVQDVEAVFLRMIFNILVCNRDDHSRQHAYLQNETGAWRLAPAFDLTYSHGPGGEHELNIDGEAKRPTRAHVANLAKRHGLSNKTLDQMIEQVRAATGQCDNIARLVGVYTPTRLEISRAITRIYGEFQAR